MLQTLRIEQPLHFMSVVFEMPAEKAPQLGFLQVMHIHLVASWSMTFSMFSREITVDGRGIGPQCFQMKLFSCASRVSVEE